ncbi:MAG: phosphoenolpyruvate carboxylase [Solirubrobacteraceae bacterium]|nr:phosphoenolpyruvate carboxylase [Solirubrobacteraceae bacterium]
MLEEVVAAGEGPEALELHRRAIALGQALRGGDESAAAELEALVAGLSVEDLQVLIRSLTRWFQLVNLAEDNERVRRLRIRESAEAPAPRRGSIRDAITRLASDGVDADELRALLAAADIELVMTAHPTEARRRTTLQKLSRVFNTLRDLDEKRGTPSALVAARQRLAASVQELWASDEIRAVSPKVLDEVRTGLMYFTSSLAEVIPALYRDLEAAVAEVFPDAAGTSVPPVLRFGSWMGGDRDGNPYVTPEVTQETLEVMREACLRFLYDRVVRLSERVSLSSRLIGEPEELLAVLLAGAEDFPELADEVASRNPEEPYRRVFSFIARRIRATLEGDDTAYDGPGALLADLRAADAALRSHGGVYVAEGDLRDTIRQVEVFGFHFARLDIREHAGIHAHAIGEILAELGIEHDYEALDRDAKISVLVREIDHRRPLIPADISGFSASTQETVETFRLLYDLVTGEHGDALRSYIVSGTSGPVDLLEVLLLMKECRLSRAGGRDALLRIVPLFESGDTLAAAAETMKTLMDLPCYRAALAGVGNEQEIMVGYSDSNKDVGYVGSGWAVYRAQVELAELMREYAVRWIFFHGRGGAVGRGGGPSNVAILAQPPGTVGGRLKVTEQGEVLAGKYSVTEIASRELELTASAALLRGAGPGDARLSEDRRARFTPVIEAMAGQSAEVYRELVYGDPDFVAFFHAVTPVDEISRLRLGSRPAKRKQTDRIEDFRAIPWVFSWTQARIVLPAWYGLGTALTAAREEHGIELLREMDADWPFFAALLSNAEMALAKADLDIARRYAALCEDDAVRERIWCQIEAEFLRTRDELIAIAGGERLLDREPVLQTSIERRNPAVDPLSFIQLELLRRRRAGESGEELSRASFLAINGISGGLRNTG